MHGILKNVEVLDKQVKCMYSILAFRCKWRNVICREANQEMQLKYQQLSTLYQASSVERDRLSELVKVLEKR